MSGIATLTAAMAAAVAPAYMLETRKTVPGLRQGLTLVHFSAQLERFVWDRECTQRLCSPC